MEKADKIVERLPDFYRARERQSYIYNMIQGIAKVISHLEQDLSLVREAHWIESANGIDLDLLASIIGIGRKAKENDEEYRSRIRHSIATLKKGGTVEAVKTQLAAYLGTSKNDIMLIENPPVDMQLEKQVVSGDTWNLTSSSINDEHATVAISIEEGEAKNPTITNLDSNVAIKFNGILKKGEVLEIHQGAAKLGGSDVTASVSLEKENSTSLKDSGMPIITRKSSTWIFREGLTDTLARFDQSKFDKNIFYKSVPPTRVTFKWTARLLAAFEVRISSKALGMSNMTKGEVEALVNAIKAGGVRTFVTILSEGDELKVVESMPERSKTGRGKGRTEGS
jgi:hypothetical protein